MIGLPAGTRIWLAAGISDMRAGMNGLVARVETALAEDPFSGQRVHDVLQILDATRQAVDPRQDQRVAPPQEIEQRLQFGAAGAAGAARLLGPDHVAASGAQRLLLQGEILVAAGNASISIERHGRVRLARL